MFLIANCINSYFSSKDRFIEPGIYFHNNINRLNSSKCSNMICTCTVITVQTLSPYLCRQYRHSVLLHTYVNRFSVLPIQNIHVKVKQDDGMIIYSCYNIQFRSEVNILQLAHECPESFNKKKMVHFQNFNLI